MDQKAHLDRITREIIGAAISVHRVLGPGLLESTYETCLAYEVRQRGLEVIEQRPVPVLYRAVKPDCGYRLDLLVESCVIVEVKSVDALLPIHQTQLISYLRLTGLTTGLLLNFNVQVLRQGIRRVVNDFPDSARLAASAVSS